MTVIAWDGTTLAADKQCTHSGYPHIVTKIFRVPDGIVGLCGDSAHCMELLKWFQEGRQRSAWPKPVNADDYANALFITSQSEIHYYGGTGGGQYAIYEERFTAAGCGRDYALAALYLGKDARAAVEVACALDIHCGQGIDTLTLNQ